MLRHRFIILLGIFTLTSLLVMLLQLTTRTVDGEALPTQFSNVENVRSGEVNTIERNAATSSTLSCREGLAGWEPYLSQGIDIQQLGGGIYLDFNAHAPWPQPDAMEFIQVIRMRQNKTISGTYLPGYTTAFSLTDEAGGLGPIIAGAPGSLWLVGNEPDRGPDYPNGPSQDDIYPQEYARAYHDIYYFIKAHDPSAQVAVGGLVEITPGRIQYLEIVWDTYAALYGKAMPADVWNMHIYILPEIVGVANVALGTDPALAYTHVWTHTMGEPNGYTYGDHDNLIIFDSQVRRMRQWMKEHGQQDKPLLLSEFGLLYGEGVTDEFGNTFTVSRAATFLTKTFSYLATTTDASLGMPSDGNRLVQQWVWFSVNNPLGYISNLVNNTTPMTFTLVGDRFRTSVATRPLLSNLQPRTTFSSIPILGAGESSTTATLSVEMINNGNQLVSVPFMVTFYANAALTEIINSTVITGGVPGCARRRVVASAAWPELGVGPHDFWVKVDSGSTVGESNEADNVMAGQAFIGTQRIYLSLIDRNFP